MRISGVRITEALAGPVPGGVTTASALSGSKPANDIRDQIAAVSFDIRKTREVDTTVDENGNHHGDFLVDGTVRLLARPFHDNVALKHILNADGQGTDADVALYIVWGPAGSQEYLAMIAAGTDVDSPQDATSRRREITYTLLSQGGQIVYDDAA